MRRPELIIIGEESTKEVVKDKEIEPPKLDLIKEDLPSFNINDIAVFVDPLDGTKEYVKGAVQHVSTLIGITVKKRPFAGVINFPFVEDPVRKLLL